MAFAVYGMAVVRGARHRPTLGGWITDNFTWRWIFYINVPIGLISLFLTNRLVEDPPFLKREQERRRGIRADYVGLGLITLAIASLQIALDKGRSQMVFVSVDHGSSHRGRLAFMVWIVWSGTIRTLSWTSIYSRSAIFATAMFFKLYAGTRPVQHDGHDSAVSAGATGLPGGEGRGGAGRRRDHNGFACCRSSE